MEIRRETARGEAFRRGVLHLKEAGISNPALDVSVLLGCITGETPATVLLERNRILTPEEKVRFDALIERRCRREALSRLTGGKEFYSRVFRITSDVLDPRPETEILVEQALDCLKKVPGHPRVLDVGTGSGVIAVTLAAEDLRATVTATDISPAALRLARNNAEDLGVLNRIRFVRTDLALGLKEAASFDIIVSNPPYISLAEYPELQPEVLGGDPAEALVAGAEGTEFYHPLLRLALKRLKPGGHLLVEVGAGQSAFVGTLFRDGGFKKVMVFRDLSGISRVVKGTR